MRGTKVARKNQKSSAELGCRNGYSQSCNITDAPPPPPISRPRAGGMHFSPPPGCIRCYASMWNRSRQGIQLTKQRLRDKLLAGPTSRSYFTRPLLSIGGRRRERAYRVNREKGGRGMARERTTEKCFRQAARIYGWTILSPVSPCSFAAAQRSVYWPASPSVLSRICAATKAVAKVATPTHLEQHATRELSPHPKYRATTVRPLLFSPFHPISSSKRGEISVDLTISCEILPPPLIIRNFCFFWME